MKVLPSLTVSGRGARAAVLILAIVFMIMPAPRADCPRAQEAAPQGVGGTETEADPAGEPGPVRVAIELEKGGTIVMVMLEEEAPVTVDRFLTLVSEGFYDGLKFHRVEKFLVQTGKKEHEYPPVEGEMFGQSVTHEVGMVGMARLPDDYDSGSTQFYIMKKHKPTFNCEYTLFARVLEGMDLVKKIDKNTKIERVVIVE